MLERLTKEVIIKVKIMTDVACVWLFCIGFEFTFCRLMIDT